MSARHLIAVVLIVGCSTMQLVPQGNRRAPAPSFCGTPRGPSLEEQMRDAVIIAGLIGGVVALGYTAISGEAPLP